MSAAARELPQFSDPMWRPTTMQTSVSPRADRGQKLLVSYREAGQMLGVCERSVWQLVKDQKLPKVTIGRSARIPVTALDDFINRQLSQV